MQQQIFYSTTFFLKAFVGLFIAAFLLLLLQQQSNIDHALAQVYFDLNTQSFPLKHHWLLDNFLHVYVKWVLVAFGLGWIVLFVVSLVYPNWLSDKPIQKFRIRFVALSAIFIPLIIGLFKHFSPVYCPWSLQEFGGQISYISFLQSFSSNLPLGQCAPAGHAASGLWLASLFVCWLPNAPKRAAQVFALGLGVGLILGWGQQMRGAHFLSHTLWSIWLTLVLLLMMWFMSRRAFIQLSAVRG